MKQTTIERLRLITDPEQIGNGKLRERIESVEFFCERAGDQVPVPVLALLLAMHDHDASAQKVAEEIIAEGAKDAGDVGVGAKPSNSALAQKRLRMAIAREARNKKNHEQPAEIVSEV